MARISIFGIGYVGVVSAACLARDGHDVIAVDVDRHKVHTLNAGRAPIVEQGLDTLLASVVEGGKLTATTDAAAAVANTEASLVCVGTPSAEDGSVGLGAVISACRDIGAALADKRDFHSVIMRSTIVPGTMQEVCIPTLEEASGKKVGRDFGVGYFPEFLRESTAIADYDDPGLVVYGAMDKRTETFLYDLNAHLPCAHQKVDVSTAEMVKYTSNAWRAVKISFANEIGNIAKASGLDGQRVMQVLCSDDKVAMSPAFLKPGFAFGGSCLPKDVRALRALATEKGVPAHLLSSVLEANEAQIARAEDMVRAKDGLRVGLVGVSFKAGTDDLRESPLATLAARLIAAGADLRIYDPFVSEAFANDAGAAGRGNAVVPELSDRMESSLDDLIAESDLVLVGNRYAESTDSLRDAAESRAMVDLARLDPGMISNGTYQGICW